MLVVRMIATVRQAADKQVAVAAFNKFCQSTVNEEEEIAHKLLGSQFAGQLDMLRLLVAEALYEEELEQVRFWIFQLVKMFFKILFKLSVNA